MAYPRERTWSNTSMPGNIVEDDIVLFAVPKKGRLNEKVMGLLKGAGLDAIRPDRLDVATCKDLPIKLVFLPAADIPAYVLDGNVDVAISGSDMLEETLVETGDNPADIEIVRRLGFGKCKLCVQAPVSLRAKDASVFAGKRIVTSFPALTRRFFDGLKVDKNGGKTKIKVVSGSVEAACGLGLADAIVDLVETGTTMRAAGLEVVEEIYESEALLFHKQQSWKGKKAEIIQLIEERINGYLTATRNVMLVYNCRTEHLKACCEITPGKRAPTITPLAEGGWQSVSCLIEKSKSNAKMDELAKAGASDILCFALANTRM